MDVEKAEKHLFDDILSELNDINDEAGHPRVPNDKTMSIRGLVGSIKEKIYILKED